MDQNQDFSALRNLLALKRLETPMNPEVDRFLIEFHRRQRAQLLVPASLWTRAMAWLGEKASSFELLPSLPYATAIAAIAVTAVLGFSRQIQVQSAGGGQYTLSLNVPSSQSSFAMIPASFGATTTASKADSLSFTTSRSDTPATATRFVLANNSHSSYDANMAF
jgi:hypothetical protein